MAERGKPDGEPPELALTLRPVGRRPSPSESDAYGPTMPVPRATLDEAVEGDLPADTRLGERYRIARLLGRGGMGTVYLARDEALGADVAIKIVRPELAVGSSGLQSLRDEVLLARQVTHPNVCRTFDLERVDGHALLTMEHVAGVTLAERVAEGPLPVEEAVRVARAVASGLAAAHARGVVHRDLKPHNVMIESATGRVVLMDFGLARRVASTRPGGECSGTPEYMAPEQVRGEPASAPADLWSLGALLYHLLVGQVVFPEARALAAERRAVERDAPDPRVARPEVPAWLARLILRLLERDPARRAGSADEVLRALDGPPRRWPAALALAGFACALAVGALLAHLHAPRAEWRPRLRELPAWDENADLPALSPDGKQLSYLSDRDGSWRIYVEPLVGGGSRPVTPARLDGQPLDPDLPRWSRDGGSLLFVGAGDRAFRLALDGSPPIRLAEQVRAVDDCGDGRLALVAVGTASCDACERLTLRRREGTERLLAEVPPDARIDFLRCDGAGRQIVYSRARRGPHKVQQPSEIFVVSVDGGAPRSVADPQRQDRYPSYPTFAPDGRTVIYSGSRGGATNLWEVAIGSLERVQLTTSAGPELAPAVSSDGRTLVYDLDETAVPLFAEPLTGGGEARRVSPTLDDVATIAVSRDGKSLVAAVRRDGRARVVTVALGGGSEASSERAIADGTSPALTPDGREVLFAADGSARLVAVPVTGGVARAVATLPGRITSIHVDDGGVAHVGCAVKEGSAVFRVAAAGGTPEREATALEILPAPSGGARAVLVEGGAARRARLVPPGHPLDDPTAPSFEARLVAWESPSSLIAWDGAALVRHRLADGSAVTLRPRRDLEGLALSPDGSTLYLTTAVGHVRRHLIENFADRPRPR